MIDDSGDETDYIYGVTYDATTGTWAKALEKAFELSTIKPDEPSTVAGKNMAVKSDTPEDQARLWQAVMDYGRSS